MRSLKACFKNAKSCSAGFQPAVSPISNRQSRVYSPRTQVRNLRYSRLEVCATIRKGALSILLLVSIFISAFGAEPLIPLNATWNYRKGTAEASNPVEVWRSAAFDDAAWPSGAAPIYYGESFPSGTAISDMRNNYTTLFLRKTFNVSDPQNIERLALHVLIDDGYIVWINGTEVARFNMKAGEPQFNGLASGTIEQTWVTNSLASPFYLVPGTNILAVQVFNSVITSSDIVFNLELDVTGDKTPPALASVTPSSGQVSSLQSITVKFSEAVQGVTASDLLIDNQAAEGVTGSGDTYTFFFSQPTFGPVDITWSAGNAISDISDPPNPFDSGAASANWSYLLKDETPPVVLAVNPPAGATIRSFSEVEVTFSEDVAGVEASDLLANGVAATSVQTRAPNRYAFEFPNQEAGAINLSWTANAQIADLAVPPNAFSGASWSYSLDPTLPVARVVISEFLASAINPAGLKDEDGELQDWIELHNISDTAVNLNGWSLTDDPNIPGLWLFPDVTLQPDAYLVVFASGKDRRSTAAGATLHTNFKLTTGGEYLGLFNADSPRSVMSQFNDYPDQRDDYSYGLDPSGQWRYYQAPTPAQPNGASSIIGVMPKPDSSAKRGLYDSAFNLVLTNKLPGASIYFTTDGRRPTQTAATLYTGAIPITNSVVIRAIAFQAGYLVSDVVTHTYILPDQVLLQPNNPPGYPVGPTAFGGYPADYEMDPEIVNDPAYGPQMKDALKALPTLSIAINVDDMFGPSNGIYTHPLSRGAQWERLCSVEFIPVEGDDFQADAGVQVQGNASREPVKNPKHAFRVNFKGAYGQKQLKYRMFPDSPVESFDTLVVRADFNNWWLHWDPTQRRRGQRTRDAWMKDSLRAMGAVASHNRYVHLYINGLYWGVYDPTERPDATFGQAYFGGDKADYDVINEGAVVDGTIGAYNTLLSLSSVATTAQYDAIKQYLDIPQFIDYMLLHFYVGHEDWGNIKNWYMVRPKDGSRGFFYLPWDGEMILGDTTINRVSNTDTPSNLHTKLIANPQYRLDFADHVQRHFFNNGALTPAKTTERWMNRAKEVELPIIAESARWGDYRRDVHQYQSPPYELYTRDNQWRAEQSRLVNTYFPARTATVLNQLKAAGLYPSIAAPVFNQLGGGIITGFQLAITAPAGTIYYTTNGADPRAYGSGSFAPEAIPFSAPITLSSPTQVKARAFSGGTWSALTEAAFTTDPLRVPLRITEIMYNPNPPGDASEFIELQNAGSLPFDPTGYYLGGISYIFPPSSIIAPGQTILLASSANPATFAQRYPGAPVFGRFDGNLDNGGGRISLFAPSGKRVISVDYNDKRGWPEEADGKGRSLEINDPFGDPDAPSNWHASASLGGSPGVRNSAPASPAIRINEILTYSTNITDWVELFNTSSASVDLSGWSVEEPGNSNRFVFPVGSIIASAAFLVIDCDKGASTEGFHAPFALDSDAETLVLRNSAGAIVDTFSSGPMPREFSLGWVGHRLELTIPTRGAANLPATLGTGDKLSINEWLANSALEQDDWLEIYNADPALPVSLRGLFLSTTNGTFEITAPVFIAPGGFVWLIADENPGPNHLDFKLPASGGTITLLERSGNGVNSVSYGPQANGVSQGRLPDGSENIVSFPISPTPGKQNSLSFPVSFGTETGAIDIGWPSLPGNRYRVEISTDLANWSTLWESPATSSSVQIKDSFTANRKYYRVMALP
jgi:hypothetical protein